MTLRVCSRPGCPTLTDTGRCPACTTVADQRRGTATQRGYTSRGHQRFRTAVLLRDPICVCDMDCPHHLGTTECLALATVADHWPVSRRDLIAQGLNPNNPDAGRGLCKTCHDRSTAREQPGGWNA